MRILVSLVILFFCFDLNAQETPIFDSLQIVAPGALLHKVSDQFSFTEGPAADRKGRVYFTDQPNDNIWRYDPDKGDLILFLSGTGRANGLYIDQEGNIIACADENNEIRKITTKGKSSVVLGKVEGRRLNGPNDLWINRNGGIYFTDPLYKRSYWKHSEPRMESEDVYYLAVGASQPVVVDGDLKKPNGIIGSVDGKILYVADIGDSKTYRYVISRDGSLKNKTLLTNLGSDGMTMDHRGNVYLTGNGVTVFDPKGNRIAHIPVPEKWTANVTFGGDKKNVLLITAGKSVYTLQMNVKGQ